MNRENVAAEAVAPTHAPEEKEKMLKKKVNVYVQSAVLAHVPKRNTDALRISGSTFWPDLVATQSIPTARPPALSVAMALLIALYKHPPASVRAISNKWTVHVKPLEENKKRKEEEEDFFF